MRPSGSLVRKYAVLEIASYGSKAGTQNRVGMTAVYSVCAEQDWSDDEDVRRCLFPIFRELIDAGCDINSKAMDQSTLLHFAAAKLSCRIVHFLCDMGASINDVDYLRRTPLHMASRNSHPGVVQCLAKFKADLNAADINHDTPLHYACLLNNLEVATALIQLGANVEATGDLGIKPIHLAAENGCSELVNQLASLSCLDHKDIWGAKPLHYAASDGNYEAVEALVGLGVDKNERDSCNMTPLDYALFRGDSLKTAQFLAQDNSVVKFGNIPPLYFPNRPVIKKENVVEYFDGLIDAFNNAGDKGLPLAHRLLSSPGLGHVDLHIGEAKDISDKVIAIIERTVERIGELDEMFEAKLLRAGSTLEDVKTGFPDEFDFLCDMVKFSRYIERTESSEAAGFARVVMREDSPPGILKFCLRTQRTINASYFLQHFKQLARQAMYDILSEGNPQIYTGHMLVTDNITLFDPLFYQKTKLQAQTMTFRGKKHKFLDVSVDLNPVLFSPVLPKEFIPTCNLLGNISSRGIYLLPKHCSQIHTFPYESVPPSADLWRYSTHHIEAEVMRILPRIGRECYVMCKLLRMEPMTCGVEYCQYEEHELTEEQLQRLYPNGDIDEDKEEEEEEEEEDDEHEHTSDDDDTEENNDVTDNALVAECAGGNIDDINVHDEQHMCDTDDENDICDIEDHNVGVDGLGIEDEMTAEHAIPSYYLKSIFIKEAENLLIEGGRFDDECLTKLPWRVYSSLLKACEDNELTTLFLPSQNMFQRAVKSSDVLEAENMRQMYCKNILRLMQNLDLKE